MRHFLNCILLLLLLSWSQWCPGQQAPFAISNIGREEEQGLVPSYIMENTKGEFSLRAKDSFLDAMLVRGELLVRNGQRDAAMNLYRTMLLYTTPASIYRTNIYSQLANLLQDVGDYEEALKVHYMALSHTSDKQAKAQLLVNISVIYIDLKDYNKAIQSLDKAISLLTSRENGYWTAIALCNKGSVYNARSQYHEAIAEFRKAYEVALSIPLGGHQTHNRIMDIMDKRCLILNNIADSYIKLDMPDSALHYLQMALPDFAKLSQYSKCFLLVTLGEIHGRMGSDKLALDYLKQGLMISEQSGYRMLSKEAYESLALVNSRMGNYKDAWNNQKKYATINDSLSSVENIHKINNLERQYDISIRDKELVGKELLISKQASRLKEQNWLAGILVLAVMSLGSIFLISRKSHRNKQKLLNEQLSSSIKDRKIMQIEAGMKGEEKERTRIAGDLHDGVVSEMLAMKLNLQALGRDHQQLKQSDDYRNILSQAEEVTEKLRKAAHNLMPANLQGNGLIQTISTFLNRINNHKVQFTFQHYGTIPDLNEVTGKIILMMTMELIQNILKHAWATEGTIQFDFFHDSMSITVEDNGVGIGNSFKEKKGMGLSNIESNVNLLNGSLDIKSSEYTGTTMLIEIPLNEHTLRNGRQANDDIAAQTA